jgi:hypothetical protein
MIWQNTKPILGSKLNFSHPLSNGIVGCWLFNEGMGDKVYDSSGNQNTGTLTGFSHPSTVTSGWNPGKFGKAIAFDGSNDYISIAHNNIFNFNSTSCFSVGMYFKTITTPGANFFVFSKYRESASPAGYPWVILLQAGKNGLFAVFDGTYNPLDTGLKNVIDGKWHSLFAIRNGVNRKLYLYIDGMIDAIATDTTINTLQNTEKIIIGGLLNKASPGIVNTTQYNGLIDFPIIYNRALSPSEVLQLYTEPFCMFNS